MFHVEHHERPTTMPDHRPPSDHGWTYFVLDALGQPIFLDAPPAARRLLFPDCGEQVAIHYFLAEPEHLVEAARAVLAQWRDDPRLYVPGWPNAPQLIVSACCEHLRDAVIAHHRAAPNVPGEGIDYVVARFPSMPTAWLGTVAVPFRKDPLG